MTRDELIKAVKVKLDEISPFDEPNEFIDGADDESFSVVKPIVSYIEDTLDKASWFCLNSLPLSLLSKDVENDNYQVNIDMRGVGHISDMEDYMRFARVRCFEWERDCTAFITTSDPNYLLQQNRHTRGGAAKPVSVYNPEQAELELFSFGWHTTPKDCFDKSHTHADVYYINVKKVAEKVKSPIYDFIALRCAAYVAEILENANTAKVLLDEFNAKLDSILQ